MWAQEKYSQYGIPSWTPLLSRFCPPLAFLSQIGSAVWFVAIVAWIVIYQTQREGWGEIGDDLSFVVPKGRP